MIGYRKKRHRWLIVAAFNKQIIIHFDKAINHAYLEKHMKKPFVDSKKIGMLRYIFEDLNIEEQKKLDLIIAVLLVQIALDTHELVPVKPQTQSAVMNRQLTVLAGDFYSGLYYELLAKSGEVSFIQTLASAIKKINEAKMVLYHENISSWDELLTVIKEIETTLYTKVANSLNISQEKISFIADSLFAFRLMEEIVKIEANQFSYIDYYVQNNIVQFNESSMILALEREIEACKLHTESYVVQLPFYITEIIDFVFGKNTLSAVEEG